MKQPHFEDMVEQVSAHPHRDKILNKLNHAVKFDFKLKDMIQVIIGATILAIPVGLTEETWNLGIELPFNKVVWIAIVSVLFVATFVYYNYYKGHMRTQWDEFFKRVLATYVVSFILVALFLTLIDKAQWDSQWVIAVKRIILVTLPASMSAAVADTLK